MGGVPGGARFPGTRIAVAVAYAFACHGGQRRKGTDVPYVAHLLGVAALVMGDGGDEDEVIAALLHDVVEDTPATVTDVAGRFGERVAAIVDACTEHRPDPKPPWRERKERHLARLAGAAEDPGVARVAAADKLDNVRSILAEHRVAGDAIWERFNAPPAEQLWYYREASRILAGRLPGELTRELAWAVDDLGGVVEADTS